MHCLHSDVARRGIARQSLRRVMGAARLWTLLAGPDKSRTLNVIVNMTCCYENDGLSNLYKAFVQSIYSLQSLWIGER